MSLEPHCITVSIVAGQGRAEDEGSAYPISTLSAPRGVTRIAGAKA